MTVAGGPGHAPPCSAPPPSAVTDCHAHVFDPLRFPYAAARHYTPPPATVDDLRALHARLGIGRVVLVQPSVYGTDNACLLDALDRLGPDARGVAVIDGRFGRGRLQDLHGAGVRGVRLNLQVSKQSDVSVALHQLQTTCRALEGTPLIVQLYATLPLLAACAPLIAAAQQPVLIDHFGLARPSAGLQQPGFATLADLLALPHVWMKLSGPYQVSDQGPAYHDIAPIAQAWLAAAPGRVVWGSDWPHTGGASRPATYRPADLEPFRQEDDAHHLQLVREWAPRPEIQHQVLWSNPARLFGFGP